MQRTILGLIAISLVMGCAARQRLTVPGAQVREAASEALGDIRGRCEFLEVVHASNRPVVDNVFVGEQTTELRTIIRNRVAELGGNVFVVVAVERYEAQAEAYQCAED